jgi:hypothetical protein
LAEDAALFRPTAFGRIAVLPRKENKLLIRVGPGTAMGETLGRYWTPACLSHEIAEPDGPPVRVKPAYW